MTVTALSWTIDAATMATLLAGDYVEQAVERDDTPYVEITRSTTRVPLVEHVEKYVWSDAAGDLTKAYRVVYYQADGTAHPTPLVIADKAEDAYCTVAQIREEGITVAQVADARVETAIDWATAYIERYTRRWFLPRFQTKIFSGAGNGDFIPLGEVPLIALLGVSIDDMEVSSLDALEVYNRHLRAEQIDDRGAPKLGVSDDVIYDDTGRRVGWYWFSPGAQNISVTGIWGYTELPRGSTPGETAAGSQVPLHYGEVPALLNWAARALVIQRVWPMAGSTGSMVAASGSMKRLKTRDQEVEWDQSSASSAAAASFASDAAIHEVLDGFAASMRVGVV